MQPSLPAPALKTKIDEQVEASEWARTNVVPAIESLVGQGKIDPTLGDALVRGLKGASESLKWLRRMRQEGRI